MTDGWGEGMTKGEQTRRKILAAAAPIFNKRGYAGCSITELMEATGLQKGGIYRHFTSKEELAAEAFEYTWKAARDHRMNKVDAAAPGLVRLKQYIASFTEAPSVVTGGCPISNTAVDSDDGNTLLRDRVRKALRSWYGRLQDMVSDAIKAGEARPDVDPKAVATVVIAALEGGLMISRLERGGDALRLIQAHLDHYIDHEVAIQPGGTAEK